MTVAVDGGLVVDPGHRQAAVAELYGPALGTLHRFGLSLGLEPVAQSAEKGDRLGQLVVAHRQVAQVDLGDPGAGLDDEGPTGGRVESETGVPLMGDEALAASPERCQPERIWSSDMLRTRSPDARNTTREGPIAYFGPRTRDEAAAVGGTGL